MHPRYLILAEGRFQMYDAKTAVCAIRYLGSYVAAVIDSTSAGRTVQDVLGFGGDIPIVSNLEEGLACEPEALLIGIAPAGGRLPQEWQRLCVRAAQAGLHLYSGLHVSLSEDPVIAEAAAAAGTRIYDLRKVPDDVPVGTGAACDVEPVVVLTVGSDCAVGKMTAAVEIVRELERQRVNALMAPTGQTGILIEGWGIAVDAVKSDFVAGAAEALVLEGAARGADVLVVEGQGALSHPAYSGVALGLIHGSLPRGMILCHEPGRLHHVGWGSTWGLPALREVVDMYERAAAWLRPAPVLAIALNTQRLGDEEARGAIDLAQRETSLPVADPVRYGAAPLARPIQELLESL